MAPDGGGGPELNLGEIFQGKRVLFAGCTGFVGKVALSMLLHHYGEHFAKVYVLARKGSGLTAERRFFEKVVTSEPFEPLRRERGEAGLLAFLREKCAVYEGDVTDPNLGLSEEDVQALEGKLDAVVNCAGLVSFNPSLEISLDVNTRGVQNAVDLCLRLGAPLVHMSTSFVVGNRSGLVFEDDDVQGYFPRKDELDGRDFSLEQELADADRIVARLREEADDKALTSTFRQKAIDRLTAEGRDVNDEKTLRLAVGRERKLWLTGQLVQAGTERAQHWGWPNTYTYTKSLGEQVMAKTPGLRYAIVRPSIVESAQRYPFPGWNEGFTTSAPLCFAILKGQKILPAGERTILDIIPVDHVCSALLAITAHTMTVKERRVYQLASGDVNPFYAARSVELSSLYKRRYYRERETGNKLVNALQSKIETRPHSRAAFETFSTPLIARGAKLLRGVIEDQKPRWGAPGVSAVLERAEGKLADIQEQAESFSAIVDLFLPFLWSNRYVFRCDNTRSVFERVSAEDRAKILWGPEKIDWREYFLKEHLPGLEKWVFPGLEEETARRRVIPAHRDLLELLEAAVEAHRHRVAFRMVEGEREERFTYGELHRYAARVGSFLLAQGVTAGSRVLLLSENRPEWAFGYFGILRAGATVVPVDPDLPEAEVLNILRRSEARACLVSEHALRCLPRFSTAAAGSDLHGTSVHTLAEAMAGDRSKPDGLGNVRKAAAADDVASLIFTSGTTGNPKGVMLTHRNFAALVAKLAGTFPIGVGDGLLSVLPLHHTFEFSCGLLTPLSRGAEITYLDELTSDRLGDAFETGRVTAMVGVPALWQLLHRKLTQEFAARPAFVEQSIRALMTAHAELRNRSRFNLGKLLFWPVHRKFGGRMKFMVSGGSALPAEVHEAFHALGFNLTEGYGLTEAAPVLAVTEPGNGLRPGSVGKPLPGVEIRIVDADADGIGEVAAKGPNVMAGYFGDREATEAVLREGWLHTGDLGRLDGEGRLYLVGRKKDVIIDANGKNVYPDELEELYGKHPRIKELSIVGLPDDAGGEKVACLCVPVEPSGDAGTERPEATRADIRAEIEAHFKSVSAGLPFHRRVKVLRIWDGGTLPRTSTLKVKRKAVVAELRRLERMSASGEKARHQAGAGPNAGTVDAWLFPLLADVLQRPVADIRPDAQLAGELGFDSLMLTELQVALEQAGVSLSSSVDLTQVSTVADLRKLVSASRRVATEAETKARLERVQPEPLGSADEARREVPVPAPVASLGRQLLAFGQRVLYGGVFDVDVKGKSFIPQNRNFLVVANHASHLDMGLVKVVLGDQGERLAALAARDYFFDTPLKRAYFENFTNLIPMDREGSLRESLRVAGETLERGFNLLIFPEGTRSPTGELLEFKPTLGYLCMTYRVDILPMYLGGTYDALPKGAVLPKKAQLEVRIGPVLEHGQLRALTEGLSRSERYRQVTRLAETAVQALRDGRTSVLPGAEVKRTADPSVPLAVEAPAAETKEKRPRTGQRTGGTES